MNESDSLFNSTTRNATLYSGPLVQTIPEQISTIISNTGGFLANSFVLWIFLRSRELWNSRNLCWLFVMFCNFGIIIRSTIKFLAFAYQDLVLCQVYVLIYFIPFMQLTHCLTLATLDRYVALTYPMWYRRRVSVKSVLIFQTSLALFTATVMTFPYWSFILPLTCTAKISGTIFYISTVYSQMLCVTSIVLHVKIYYITRDYFRRNPIAFQQRFLVIYRSEANSYICSCSTASPRNPEGNAAANNRPKSCTSVRGFRNRLSKGPPNELAKPELQAATTLAIGMLPVLIVFLPSQLVYIHDILCTVTDSYFYSDLLMRIYQQMILWQVLYSPAIYCCSSQEFKKALRRFVKRYCVVSCR